VDALEPSILPATSSPEVDGLSYAQAMTLIAATAARNSLVGMDVVELAPGLDASGNSALLVARLVVETLAEVFG
jgi:agmatinase